MNMRAKMMLMEVNCVSPSCENLRISAVVKNSSYPPDGSNEDNTYALWTPTANLSMSITNPALHGKFQAGQQFYVDFTLAD